MSTPDNPPPATPVTPAAPASQDNTVAILAYLTIIGFIIAIVLHGNKKTAIGSYHLRQALGLIVTGIAIGIGGIVLVFIPILGWLTLMAIWITFLVLVIMGLISAISGQQKPVPVMGEKYQKWFANAFV